MSDIDYKKLDELISKFKNGKKLYRESATFNVIIQSMIRGVSEFEIIEMLILKELDTSKAMEALIMTSVNPYTINYDPTT